VEGQWKNAGARMKDSINMLLKIYGEQMPEIWHAIILLKIKDL
jgi:hypothetical protein